MGKPAGFLEFARELPKKRDPQQRIIAKNPLDKLIFEQGLRIKKLFFDTELDLMLVLLTNGRVLNLKLSGFSRLRNATTEQLADYELENQGTAVSWESLNEDLSVRGFIKQAALEETLYHLAKVV